MNNDEVVFNGLPNQQVSQPQPIQQAEPAQQPFVPAGQNPISQQPINNYQPPQPEQDKKPSAIKKILKILLGFLVFIVFVGIMGYVIFGNHKNSPFSGGGKVTLTYWGLFQDQSVMEGIISDFEKQNPNITISYSKQDINQYRERLSTRINAGTGPDIFRFHNTWYPMLSHVLLPLPSDTITKDEFARTYYPVAQKDLIKNGGIYGIPLEIETLSLFVNSDLFSLAGLSTPVTWNEFITDARAITVKDENGKIKTAGAGIGTYDNVTHAPDIISLLFLQNGVDLTNLQSSSERFLGALSFYTSFATDKNNVWDDTLDPSLLAFSKGNLGMFFGYPQDYFAIKQFNSNLKFQVIPVPQLLNQNVTLASYWVEGVSAKSPHQKEALLFMKFLAKKETEEKLYLEEAKSKTFGEPYARVDLADQLKVNQDAYTFVSQAPAALSSPFVDGTSDNGLNQQLNTYLKNAIDSILKNMPSDTVFQTFLDGFTAVFQKYQ